MNCLKETDLEMLDISLTQIIMSTENTQQLNRQLALHLTFDTFKTHIQAQ